MSFNREHMVHIVRRDAVLVWNAAVASVIIGFVVLAIGAAVIDILALRH